MNNVLLRAKHTEIYATRERFGLGIGLHIAQHVGDDKLAVALPLMFKEAEVDVITTPCMNFDITAAQRLMDELWQCGLRPSEGTGSAGSLAATERHLADMRTIAFHTINIKPE
jgi:hypothetical protein